MPFSVILIVLFAAFLHASWNVIVKGGPDKLFETALYAMGGGLASLVFLPFLPLPPPSAWGLLMLSWLLHLVYYIWMAQTYQIGDLSLCYPVMRGTAPILTAIVMTFLGSSLNLYGWAGILLLCAGIFSLALDQKYNKKDSLRSLFYALRTSLIIMGYTIADGYGARHCINSFSFTCWLFFLNIFPLQIYILFKSGAAYREYFKKRAWPGLLGGCCGLASYGIAIWAMTLAPIALVAALRETSVIFGMMLAVFFLGEKLTPLRIAGALLALAGALLVRSG